MLPLHFGSAASQNSSSDFTSRGKKMSTASMGSSTSGGDIFNVKEMSEAPLGTLSVSTWYTD